MAPNEGALMAAYEHCGEPAEGGQCRLKEGHEGGCKWWGPPRKHPDRCTVGGCEKEHYGRGYCSMHWNRWHRHGSPHVVLDSAPDTEAATLANIEKGKRKAADRLRRYRSGETVNQLAESEGISPKSMADYLRERCGVEFHEPGDPLDADAVLEAIFTQICPWCGRGPYKALANHTNPVHEVTAEDLCEWADIPKSWATCDPELVELHREMQIKLEKDMDYVRSFQRDESHHEMSEAGRRVLRETLRRTQQRVGASEMARRAWENTPPERREKVREQGKKIGQIRGEQVRKIPRRDYPTIIARLNAGETTTAIAAEYGVHRDYIGAIRRGERPRRPISSNYQPLPNGSEVTS